MRTRYIKFTIGKFKKPYWTDLTIFVLSWQTQLNLYNYIKLWSTLDRKPLFSLPVYSIYMIKFPAYKYTYLTTYVFHRNSCLFLLDYKLYYGMQTGLKFGFAFSLFWGLVDIIGTFLLSPIIVYTFLWNANWKFEYFIFI